MAVLSVWDDDGEHAEAIRIRVPETTIGRVEGDVVIPHDKMMTATHARLSCRLERGRHRWYLTDLKSTNGTFLRVRTSKLQHDQELMIGMHRYRFDSAPQGAQAAEEQDLSQTLGWKRVSPDEIQQASPRLIRLTPQGETEQFLLLSTNQVVGSQPGEAQVVIGDDGAVSPAHARIMQDEHRRWYIEDLLSRNGVWLAISEVELDKDAQFQLGEQRLTVQFP